MPTNARKTAWYSTGGPWGTGLLFLGIFGLLYGIGTVFRPEHLAPPGLVVLSDTVPLGVWAWGWIAAGAWSVGRALTPPQRHRNTWPMVGMASLWQAAFLVHWLAGGLVFGRWSYEWLSWAAWALIAALLISWGKCVNPPVDRRKTNRPPAVERRKLT